MCPRYHAKSRFNSVNKKAARKAPPTTSVHATLVLGIILNIAEKKPVRRTIETQVSTRSQRMGLWTTSLAVLSTALSAALTSRDKRRANPAARTTANESALSLIVAMTSSQKERVGGALTLQIRLRED